jgi:hypothetical protein
MRVYEENLQDGRRMLMGVLGGRRMQYVLRLITE